MLDGRVVRNQPAAVTIGVVRLPRISNYTDFESLENEPDVTVHYLSDPIAVPNLDVLILPGTKNTVADLGWLRATGWEDFLVRQRRGAVGWLGFAAATRCSDIESWTMRGSKATGRKQQR